MQWGELSSRRLLASSRIVYGIGTLAAKPGCRARRQAKSLSATRDDSDGNRPSQGCCTL
jgi:hypothetical protein